MAGITDCEATTGGDYACRQHVRDRGSGLEQPGWINRDTHRLNREVLLPAPYRRRVRVGFVLHIMQVAGAEVLVKQTIQQLRERIEPTVFCLDGVGPLGEELRAAGVDVICLDRKPGRDWMVGWRLARECRARNVEVLHAHQYSPFFYAALARLLSGGTVRVILTEHGRHFPDSVAPLRRAVNRLVLDRLADAVNAVCRFSAESLCRVDGFRGARIEVIQNGIDIGRYTATVDRIGLKNKLGLDCGRRYVASIGRLHPVKDHATLLRAFAQCAAAVPDTDLLLVGDGPLRGELERLVVHLDCAARVRFLGVRHDVPDILKAVNLFALTSISEAASLTLLEAMASGLPVLVTAVGGNPEIVRHGRDGLLVGRGEVSATAAALGQLLNDSELARNLGRSGQARVLERYRLENTIESYGRLYGRLGACARVRPRVSERW